MGKTCFKCGEWKPLEEFYRHPTMADGFLGKCKDCTRRDVAVYRARNIERVRTKDRERARNPHVMAAISKRAKETYAKLPERRAAHRAVRSAVRSGKIRKPEACAWCGVRARIEGHHYDYSKPLDVVWLCKPCHCQADKLRRKAS